VTLATLRNPVRHKVGLSDNDAAAPDAIVNEVINEALQSITTEKDWPWLYTEASGSPDLALPGTYDRTIFLTVNGRDLEPRSPRDLARFRSTSAGVAVSGIPEFYTFAGTNLKLSPSPASGTVYPYIHAFYQTEAALVADADTPKLPSQYQGWLVTRAAMLLAIRTDNPSRLPKLQVEDERWRNRVIDSVRRAGASPSIRRTKESIWQDV
jgi:hypothetical protein